MLEVLPTTVPARPGRPDVGAGPDHPMRRITEAVAGGGPWTAELQAWVRERFDELAGEWDRRFEDAELSEPVDDALARGALPPGPVVEVGAGTGRGTRLLAAGGRDVVAVDLSLAMVRQVPAEAGWAVQADGAALPVRSGGAAVVALVNAFLFPHEVDRVLAPGGAVLWVTTLAEATPIYLPPADVAAALPGAWEGVTARAGWGQWCVLRRSGAGR